MRDYRRTRNWKNLEVRRESDTHRTRWTLGLLAGLLVALAPVGFVVRLHQLHLDWTYELDALREERTRLEYERQRLLLEKVSLESPTEIGTWAESMGLAPTASERAVVVERRVEPDRRVPTRIAERPSTLSVHPRQGL